MKLPTDKNTFLVGHFNAEVLKTLSNFCASVEVHSFVRVIVTSTSYLKKKRTEKQTLQKQLKVDNK